MGGILWERVDDKTERKAFIKNLTVEAENLMSVAKSETVRKECKIEDLYYSGHCIMRVNNYSKTI